MPRGIPNAKRDETGMKYTTFHVPLAPNPKYSSSTYLKSDANTLWHRNARNSRPATNGHVPEQRRGQQTLVIHPGSSNFRIGRASDISPVVVPAVVARKFNAPVHPSPSHKRIPCPADPDEPISPNTTDQILSGIAAIQSTLYSYMAYLNVPRDPNGSESAREETARNASQEQVATSDPSPVDWIFESDQPYYLGSDVHRLADPSAAGYIVRSPIHGINFNGGDYSSLQAVLNDVELIIRETLRSSFDILPRDYHNHSVVLVIPDFYETYYVREFVHLLLVQMGFKQLCVQQESLAAAYGSGTSTACVVNFGAAMTSMACVDEGIVNPDTRIVLDIGGDDITEFLHVILQHCNFPYRECDLARSYDWQIMENLKKTMCTLREGDVALKTFNFPVRRPGKPFITHRIQVYDAPILAPMLYFHDFQSFLRSEPYAAPYIRPDTTEEIMEPPIEHATDAMKRVTAHLMPPPAMALTVPMKAPTTASSTTPSQLDPGSKTTTTSASPADDAAMDVDGIEAQPHPALVVPAQKQIDIFFEASKTPLDAALFNSIRMAGEDRIIKYLNAVIITGGPANMKGMVRALESRLQSAAQSVMQNTDLRTHVIPPPKDVDPSVLVWKGAAVLGKMESVSELWITPTDWDLLGMRGLKERCFYI
ncbi:hypothetical protein HDZ31DRAFT_31536 [Schizophyllum fasciatum]